MGKKVLSIILAVAMFFTLLPVSAFSAFAEDTGGELISTENGTNDEDINYFYLENIGNVTASIDWRLNKHQHCSKNNKKSFENFDGHIDINPGEKYYFMFSDEKTFNEKTIKCNTQNAKLAAGGDIRTLLDESGNVGEYPENAFRKLFYQLEALADISDLILCTKDTLLGKGCFESMFEGCKELKTVPIDLLPAKNLEESCYNKMFYNCSNLNKAPVLPAIKLKKQCYYSMFEECPNLSVIKFDFTAWDDSNESTTFFLPDKLNPGVTLVIYCSENLDTSSRGRSKIPENIPVIIENKILIKVQFYKMGGSGGSDSFLIIYGETMPEITIPTREGYNFEGYFDFNGERYYNADGTPVRVWDKSSNQAFLVAVWIEKKAPVHEHTFAGDWSYSATHHWHIATCEHNEFVSGFGAHIWDGGEKVGNDTVYTCTECKYKKTEAGQNVITESDPVFDQISFYGSSLALSSDISINFYMILTDEEAKNGVMTFTVNGNSFKAAAQYNKTEKKYYFRCPINILEIATTVNAVFTYNGKDYTKQYSVKNYVNTVTEAAEGKYEQKIIELCKKIANYGYFAQHYLASIHSGVTIGGEGYAEMVNFGAPDIKTAKSALSEFEFTDDCKNSNISSVGRSLNLDDKVSMNFYISVEEDYELTENMITVSGDKEFTFEKVKDKEYRISILDIEARNFGENYTLTVDGEKITASVLSYANKIVNEEGFGTKAQNSMAALYEYYIAACEFIK